jgi:hypothetical protein
MIRVLLKWPIQLKNKSKRLEGIQLVMESSMGLQGPTLLVKDL